MTSILIAAAAGLFATLLGTPIAIRLFRAWGWGQRIRDEGPHHPPHAEKMGTPTMGGIVIIAGMAFAYLLAHSGISGELLDFTPAGLCVLGLTAGLGIVGFVDDLLKTGGRKSLGMGRLPKLAGQAFVASIFGFLAVRYAGASTELSFIRGTGLDLGLAFYLWSWLMVTASSNAVNLTDGLDGLASGSMALVMASYVVIAFWQLRHPNQYGVEHAFDLAIVAAAGLGAVAGFLWWNAAPARIFMGDTGSLALGGLAAGLAIMTQTQLLLLVLGGLYVMETVSVILQGAAFKLTGKRIFRMAPIHHHFEVGVWPEFTVIVRFWIVAGLSVAFGLGLFYADFLARGGVL